MTDSAILSTFAHCITFLTFLWNANANAAVFQKVKLSTSAGAPSSLSTPFPSALHNAQLVPILETAYPYTLCVLHIPFSKPERLLSFLVNLYWPWKTYLNTISLLIASCFSYKNKLFAQHHTCIFYNTCTTGILSWGWLHL